jgi:hypothetical protein
MTFPALKEVNVMPVKLKIIRAHDFLVMSADGEYDFDAAKRILVEIALAKHSPPDFEVLLDLRHAMFNLSTTDIYYLAAELVAHHEAFREKLAILVRPGISFDQAEFFETCAHNRGFNVDAFCDFEDAINWLFPSTDTSKEKQS